MTASRYPRKRRREKLTVWLEIVAFQIPIPTCEHVPVSRSFELAGPCMEEYAILQHKTLAYVNNIHNESIRAL